MLMLGTCASLKQIIYAFRQAYLAEHMMMLTLGVYAKVDGESLVKYLAAESDMFDDAQTKLLDGLSGVGFEERGERHQRLSQALGWPVSGRI